LFAGKGLIGTMMFSSTSAGPEQPNDTIQKSKQVIAMPR
jgi:hypothetical protein